MIKRKPIFYSDSYLRDYNIVLNHRGDAIDLFDGYAEAFHRSGKFLFQQLTSHSYGYNDLSSIPIVFLYRHSFELYLKATIRLSNVVLEAIGGVPLDGTKELKEHKLKPLVILLDKIFKKLDLGFDPWDFGIVGLCSYEDFEILIDEWNAVDEGSFSFRYPCSKEEQPYLSKNFRFHLPTFCEVMDEVLHQLDGMVMGLRERHKQIEEWKS